VGALNAAYVCRHGFESESIERLGAIWRRIRRNDVFPFDPVRQALALAGRRPSLCSSAPLRRLIETHLASFEFGQAAVPLHIVATDVMSGEDLLISSGDAVSAVLASAAIPAVFPAVEREGRTLIDGGVANNTAVSHAVALGADRVVILPAGFACALDAAPSSPLGSATHALTLLIEQRLIVEISQLRETVEMVVLPPLCPLAVRPIDFGSAGELIDRSRRATSDWLDSRGHRSPMPERFLSLHHHPRPRQPTNQWYLFPTTR
jgi:NTE family protein